MKSWRLISLIPRLAVIYIYIYSQFFENQPNEICSHLSEKASKVGFFKPEKLQSHSNEGKGEEGKKKRREGKEGKKKAKPALLVFIIATWEIFGQKKNRFTQMVHLAIYESRDRPSVRPFCPTSIIYL